MDVDGPESGTQNIFQANDHGVEVDFDELDEDEEEDASDKMDEQLVAAVARIQSEIDKMSVNLKAIERCVLSLSPAPPFRLKGSCR